MCACVSVSTCTLSLFRFFFCCFFVFGGTRTDGYIYISGLGHVFIVTELACGGDLLAMLLSEREVRACRDHYI